GARMFLADKSRNFYDEKKNTLNLSKIFKWYGDDFGDVALFVKKYMKNSKITEATDIDYLDYDWNLNEKL
ncbi:DUF547 domain-containing protein, partial [bacterium]|nr:DUF547 domain-containing protein [bacterium]